MECEDTEGLLYFRFSGNLDKESREDGEIIVRLADP